MTTEDIRAELQQNIDEKYRAFHASLVPGIGTFLGDARNCKKSGKRRLSDLFCRGRC